MVFRKRYAIFLILSIQIFCCVAAANVDSCRLLVNISVQKNFDLFFKTLDQYYALLSGKNHVHFLITCSNNNCVQSSVQTQLKKYRDLDFSFDCSNSWVSVFNREINKYQGFDFLLIVDENTAPQIKGYDDIIVQTMKKSFADTDGVLCISDDSIDNLLNKYAVMGKKYYQRFGYVYHPHYTSVFAQNELFDVAQALGKLQDIHKKLFKKNDIDQSCNKRDEAATATDRLTYQYRKSVNFNINPVTQQIIKLSILIPTLAKREKSLLRLCAVLEGQILYNGLNDRIEIVIMCDNGEMPVGTKRNKLLEKSRGEYVCFIDDDDMVSADYIKLLYDNLASYPDCLSLKGIITTNGKNPRLFVHSLCYKKLFESNGVYYRPPNHLNPIRRDIAIRFTFPSRYVGEDSDWCLQISNSGLLQHEVEITTPYYFYLYCSTNSVQSIVNKDEKIEKLDTTIRLTVPEKKVAKNRKSCKENERARHDDV